MEPFLDDRRHGVFATRHPCRPNHLGISIVEFVLRNENLLHVRGIDVLDLTLLLDIKPYVPNFDHRQKVRIGWYAKHSRS